MNLTHILKSLVIIILWALVVTGCSLKSNLDDMHDKTAQMAQTTETLSTTSSNLKTYTQDLFFGQRTLATRALRKKDLEDMTLAPDMPHKLANAGSFYYAQEFQSYIALDLDDEKELEALKTRAIEELFEYTQGFYTPAKHFWEAWLPLSDHTLDIDALAATMHYVLPEQLIKAEQRNFKPMSVYSILEEALLELHNNPNRAPSTMPRWMYLTQNYSPIAIDLLKARFSYLPFQLYAELENLNGLSKLKIWETSRADQKNWVVHLYDRNLSQITRHCEYMEYALQTKKLLVELGLNPQLDKNENNTLKIQTIFQHMTIAVDPTQEKSPKKIEVERFKYLAGLLLMNTQDFIKVSPETYLPAEAGAPVKP